MEVLNKIRKCPSCSYLGEDASLTSNSQKTKRNYHFRINAKHDVWSTSQNVPFPLSNIGVFASGSGAAFLQQGQPR